MFVAASCFVAWSIATTIPAVAVAIAAAGPPRITLR
jgi:hypothetical protein